jgi:hypothetical protein
MSNYRIAMAATLGATAVLVAWYAYARKKARRRCLVTGFNDWRNLPSKDAVWTSRENPSSRIILGGASGAPPLARDGPLPRRLRRSSIPVDWSFVTLPTLWRTACGVDYFFYDVVVHLGLGVYDRTDTILVEAGAFNGRVAAADAAGHLPPAPELAPFATDLGGGGGGGRSGRSGEVLEAPTRVARTVEAVRGLALGGGLFRVEVAPARRENTYICNETHWRALEAVWAAAAGGGGSDGETSGHSVGGRLRAAFFVHVPYPAGDDNYEPLSAAVAELVERLVAESLREY